MCVHMHFSKSIWLWLIQWHKFFVRSRSFLVGSVGSGVYSMLGPEELERYFPDRRIHIWVGTWNMNEIKVGSAVCEA